MGRAAAGNAGPAADGDGWQRGASGAASTVHNARIHTPQAAPGKSLVDQLFGVQMQSTFRCAENPEARRCFVVLR